MGQNIVVQVIASVLVRIGFVKVILTAIELATVQGIVEIVLVKQ